MLGGSDSIGRAVLWAEVSVDNPFLHPEEYKRFLRDYPRFPRRVQELRLDTRLAPEAVDLEEMVRSTLEQLERRRTTGPGMASLVISVRWTDGMSWSATAADRVVAESPGKFQRLHLKGVAAPNRLPAIAGLVSRSTFASLAQDNGLTTSFLVLRPLVRVSLIVAAVALGIAMNVLQALTAAAAGSGVSIGLLVRPSFLVSSSLLVVAALLSQNVLAKLQVGETSAAMAELVDAIERRQQDPEYRAFIEDVARRLARLRRPRCVVVDRFEKLDATTQSVIHHYFQKYHNHAETTTGSDLWIIFEDRETGDLRRRIIKQKQISEAWVSTGYRNTRLYEQLRLEPAQRRRLAELDGLPDRHDRLTVGRIRHPELEHDERFDQFVDHYRDAHPASPDEYGPLELYYLLALTCTLDGSLRLADRYLSENLHDPDGALTRSKVLKTVLRGTHLRSGEFGNRLHDMRLDFDQWIEIEEVGSSRELQFAPGSGEALSNRGGRLGLPNAKTVHLFWALFWHDKLQKHPLQAFWIQKLATHALRAQVPLFPDRSLREEVTGALFRTILFAVDGCMRCCLLIPVPELLERASLLVEEFGADEQPPRRRDLIGLAWKAYCVLGNDKLLGIAIHAQSPLEGGRQPTVPSNPLERLFPLLLSIPADRRLGLQADLLAGVGQSGMRLRANARIRAAWFALALRSVLWSGFPHLSSASMAAVDELPMLLNGVIRRLDTARDHQLMAIDVTSLSLGLWSLILAVRMNAVAPEVLHDALERSFWVAEDLYDQRVASESVGGFDFIVDMLAKELWGFVGAGVALLRSQRPLARLRFTDDGRMEGLVQQLGAHLGIRGGRLDTDAIEDQLDLLRITWERLGFRWLGSMVNLRRSQLQILSSDADSLELLRDTVENLAQEFGVGGSIALMANLIASESIKESREISASYLNHGALAAIDARMGEELVGELCLLAIHESHSYSYDLGALFEYLLRPHATSPSRSRLSTLIGDLPDWELGSTALCLLNATEKAELPGVSHRVSAILERRAEAVDDPAAAERVHSELDMFRLRTRVQQREAVDPEEVIATWRGRAPEMYAFALYLLLGHGGVRSDTLVSEAREILEEVQDVSNSGYLLLAKEVIRVTSAAAGRDGAERAAAREAAVRFLDRVMPKWEARLSAALNMDIYWLLFRETKSGQHEEKLVRWQVLGLERSRLRDLPSLVQQGRFFLLFWHYYDALSIWGLETDLPFDRMQELLNVGEAERRRLIADWARDGRVPEPFLKEADRYCLSSDFLRYGRYLFTPPLDEDSRLDGARQEFDEFARYALPTLYREITSAKSIPRIIREVLQRHDSLLQYTVPL
jgi:hypothetical protein